MKPRRRDNCDVRNWCHKELEESASVLFPTIPSLSVVEESKRASGWMR